MPPDGEAAARRFYGELLGFAERPKPPQLAGRGGCWFECGAARVHLGVEHPFAPARKAHPAFLVEDLPGLVAKLEAAGVATREDVQLEGFVRTYAHDLFGNRIELMEKSG